MDDYRARPPRGASLAVYLSSSANGSARSTSTTVLTAQRAARLDSAFAACAGAFQSQLVGALRVPVSVRAVQARRLTLARLRSSIQREELTFFVDVSPLHSGPGTGVIVIDARLGLAWIDRMLGGRLDFSSPPRAPTAIERSVLGQLVRTLTRPLTAELRTCAPVDVRVRDGSWENDPLGPADEVMLDWEFLVRYGPREGRLRCVLPDPAAWPWPGQKGDNAAGELLRPARIGGERPSTNAPQAPGPDPDGDTRVVAAVIGSAMLTGRDVYSLRVGDIVCFERPKEGPIAVTIGGKPVYVGEPVNVDGRRGVRLVTKIDNKAVDVDDAE